MQRASSRAVCCTGDALRNRSVERGHGGGGGSVAGGRLWSQRVVVASYKVRTGEIEREPCLASAAVNHPGRVLAAVPGSPVVGVWAVAAWSRRHTFLSAPQTTTTCICSTSRQWTRTRHSQCCS